MQFAGMIDIANVFTKVHQCVINGYVRKVIFGIFFTYGILLFNISDAQRLRCKLVPKTVLKAFGQIKAF